MACREASCSCGKLRVTCEGDPKYVLACHCLDCQRRTGSVFGVSAYFRQAQITPSGADKIFVRDGGLFTSAGVTAGIDLCLALVTEDWGHELALRVAKRLIV